MRSSVHEGMKRGVRIGFVYDRLSFVSRIQRSVSRTAWFVEISPRYGGQPRFMLTLPTQVTSPVSSSRRISSSVAGTWSVAKIDARVVVLFNRCRTKIS